MKLYYTKKKSEEAQWLFEHPEESKFKSYTSWTEEEKLNALKNNADLYRARYYFWKSAKVVKLEVYQYNNVR